MALLASRSHTVGNTRQLTVDYDKWLSNTAEIASIAITSSSPTLTVKPTPVNLKTEVQFFVTGGNLGETATLSLMMTDTIGNVSNDTIAITVVAP